jgi:hypothetical protein
MGGPVNSWLTGIPQRGADLLADGPDESQELARQRLELVVRQRDAGHGAPAAMPGQVPRVA